MTVVRRRNPPPQIMKELVDHLRIESELMNKRFVLPSSKMQEANYSNRICQEFKTSTYDHVDVNISRNKLASIECEAIVHKIVGKPEIVHDDGTSSE